MILNRRRFLSALGLTGAAATLTSPRFARAAPSGPPKRLIIVSSSHGTVYDGWKMRNGGQSESQAYELDLTSMDPGEYSRGLAPLAPYANRLLVMDGLSMSSAELDLAGYRHEKGWIHAWTGGWVYFPGSSLLSTKPSLDQLVAAEIARPDRLPSLELSVMEGRPICHAGKAQQLPMEEDPGQAWKRLYGLSTSDDPLIAAQGSVLDYALAEHAALAPKLGAADRARLDTHFDLVRQLEQRIAGLANAECTAPAVPAPTLENYDASFKAHADLVASAFSCDMTRVVSMSLGDVPSEAFGWGWYLSGDAHNDFAHRLYEDQQAAEAMTDYHAFHSAQMAYLIGLLESIPDTDGGSLMDNTLIVWGGELADGWHGYERYFAMTAGGSWYFKPGRYLHWPQQTPIGVLNPAGTTSVSGKPHQHLLTSVARAMGLDVDYVGIPEVQNLDGERINLSGELPDLT